jgi:hypothetical protein
VKPYPSPVPQKKKKKGKEIPELKSIMQKFKVHCRISVADLYYSVFCYCDKIPETNDLQE